MKLPPLGLAVAAFLYGAICLTANAVAGELTLAQRDGLKALRGGDMAKLVVHEQPRPRVEVPFTDLYGNRIEFGDYAGKVVLLNVWATWCPPCRAEMPSLNRLAGALEGEDFALVPLSTDRAGPERVAEYFKENGFRNLDVLHDRSGDVARQVGVLGLPVSVILDRQGREIARLHGDADWDSSSARQILQRVIELTRATDPTIRT
jgi:thiol-disulfide isomerase/thioredoxin